MSRGAGEVVLILCRCCAAPLALVTDQGRFEVMEGVTIGWDDRHRPNWHCPDCGARTRSFRPGLIDEMPLSA